jgi:hypothetical protein
MSTPGSSRSVLLPLGKEYRSCSLMTLMQISEDGVH